MSVYESLEDKNVDLNLPMLKKYYKGKIANPELFASAGSCFYGRDIPENIECWANPEDNTLEIEFQYMASWSGEEKKYDCIIKCKPGWVISSVGALRCQRYCYSDALSDGYRGCRPDDYDFYLLDRILAYCCNDLV